MIELLLVQKVSPVIFLHLGSELRVLEEFKVVQRVRITSLQPYPDQHSEIQAVRLVKNDNALEKPCILLLSPVPQVLQISNKVRLLEYPLLSERMQVKWVGEGLDEFEFELETSTVLRSGIRICCL